MGFRSVLPLIGIPDGVLVPAAGFRTVLPFMGVDGRAEPVPVGGFGVLPFIVLTAAPAEFQTPRSLQGGAGFGMQAPRVRRPKRRREFVYDDVAIATALLLMFGD